VAPTRAFVSVAAPITAAARPRRKRARSEAPPLPAGIGGGLHGAPLGVQLLLSAQRTAGNRAISALVAQRRAGLGADAEPTAQRGIVDDAEAAAGGLLDALRGRAASVVASVRAGAAAAWDRLSSLASSVTAGLEGLAGSAIEALGARWQALQDQARSLWDALSARASALAAAIKERLGQLAGRLRAGWEALKSAGRHLLDELKQRAAALLEAAKGQGTSLLAASPGTSCCVPPAGLARARSALDGQGGAELGGLDGAASGAPGDLAGRWLGLDGESHSGSGALGAHAGAASAELGGEVEHARGSVGSGGAELRERSATAGDRLREESSTRVDAVGTDASTAADGVGAEAEAGTAGLRGMLGTLGDLIARAAGSVIGSAEQQTRGAHADLRARGGSLVSRLRDLAGSLARRLASAVERIESGLRAVAQELAARADAARRLLQEAWAWARERSAVVMGKLRTGWDWIRSRAGGAWRTMRDRLLGLRGRADAALELGEGESCRFEAAGAAGDALAAATIQAPGGAAIGNPVLFKGRPGAALTAAGPAAVRAPLGAGRSLESGVRARMERAFGADFSRVRVHTDAGSARVADELSARAFTVGDHVAFGTGEYRPDTPIGDALIAHELAHLVQQRDADTETLQAEDGSETAVELDADRSAVLAVARLWLGARAGLESSIESAMPLLRSGLRLRRCGSCNTSTKCCTEVPVDAGALIPVEAEHDCQPFAEDRNNVFKFQNQAKPGSNPLAHPTIYGLTTIDIGAAAGSPAGVTLDDKCQERCGVSLPSAPRFSLGPFVYTKTGRYDEGENFMRRAPKGTKCAGKRLPTFEVISESLAARIKAAEVEHCQDHKVAWRKSVGRYVAAVNEVAKAGFCVEHGDTGSKQQHCKDEYERRLKERSGMSYAGMRSIAECLFGRTDERDEKKYHSISGKSKVVVSADCTEIEVHAPDDAKVLSHVGDPKSEDLVKDCLEPK
jgi:Domain of unknown function (DUF4157)